MYFFTADEHYGHTNIIKYCNRPFDSVDKMDKHIIWQHNKVVSTDDVVVHAGDFCWSKTYDEASQYIKQLNGNHIFLKGSHDRWIPQSAKFLWRKLFDIHDIKILMTVCHYAMRTWERSHYNSWQLHGHSHGRLESQGKQYDVGVDCNNFRPVSFDQIVEIMKSKPNNFNFIPIDERR